MTSLAHGMAKFSRKQGVADRMNFIVLKPKPTSKHHLCEWLEMGLWFRLAGSHVVEDFSVFEGAQNLELELLIG